MQQSYVKYHVPDRVSSAKGEKKNINKDASLKELIVSLDNYAQKWLTVHYEKCYNGNMEDVQWMT